MVVVAVTLGFFIGGGPSLLTDRDEDELGVLSASADTTTTGVEETTTSTAAASETTTTTVAARPASEVSVRVYNGSTKAGQAVRVGDRLKAAGYQVLAPGPSPGDPLPTSIIHFAEGYWGDALALATALDLPASVALPAPNPPLVTGVGDAKLVLIVADDLVLPA